MIREREHISMEQINSDGTKTPLTMPNHPKIKASTLRTICTQSGISRDDFLHAYEKPGSLVGWALRTILFYTRGVRGMFGIYNV